MFKMDNEIKNISPIEGVQIKLDEDLTRLSTFRLKTVGHLAIVESEQGLQKLIYLLKERKILYRCVGWGANQLLPSHFKGLFIKLNFSFERSYLDVVRSEYELPASVGLNLLTSHAMKFGLKGWENFTGIPGSVGGAIFMNAGTTLGDFGSLIKNVRIMRTDGTIKTHKVKNGDFSYRKNNIIKDGEVILSATLVHLGQDPQVSQLIKDYWTKRIETQPLQALTCGCVFKNYDSNHLAGKAIDLVGLKGLCYGGVRISQIHGNFMENYAEATYNDFIEMVSLVTEELYLNYGVKFETEVQFN